MPISRNAVPASLLAVFALALSLPGTAPAAEKESAGGATGTVAVPPETPTAPPKNLRKVGDHWTPYAPPDPESFPPQATVHIIVPGDTLWDLADLTYNNPWLWPQLWNENRYITDSHWIYPGDPLLLPPRPVVVSGPGAVPTEILPQGQEGAPHTDLGPLEGPENGGPEAPLQAETAQEAPAPGPARHGREDGFSSSRLIERDDLRCSGYITEDTKRADLFIAENEEPGYQTVTLGSLVYLNRGGKEVQPGATFTIVEREGKVLHPVTGRTQGIYTKRLGELRVLKVLDETAIATVTFACDEMRVGDELRTDEFKEVPEGPIPPFDRLRVEPNGKPTGFVIHTKDLAVRVAAGDIVQIDLGSEDGIQPGATLTAFSPVVRDRLGHMPEYHFQYQNEVFTSPDLHYDDGRDVYPELPIAQMMVMTTAEHTATAKVIYSIRELTVGSPVELD